MSDLPKRGDRVRVTEVMYQPSLLGRELELTNDAHWYDDSQTWMRFRCEQAGYVGPVKVELLERAHASKVEIIERDGYKFTLTCRKCGLAMKLEAGPLKRHDTTIDTCALCDEKSAEFARGMRRAVRIAERLCARDDAFYHLANELKEAVEKELKP